MLTGRNIFQIIYRNHHHKKCRFSDATLLKSISNPREHLKLNLKGIYDNLTSLIFVYFAPDLGKKIFVLLPFTDLIKWSLSRMRIDLTTPGEQLRKEIERETATGPSPSHVRHQSRQLNIVVSKKCDVSIQIFPPYSHDPTKFNTRALFFFICNK